MAKLEITTGDATTPQVAGNKIVAHVCNDVGGWGSGFVVAVSRRWKEPESQYRKWARNGMCSRVGCDKGLELSQKYICVECNNSSSEWPTKHSTLKLGFKLGSIQHVQVEPDVWVTNMVAQRGVRHDSSADPAIRYDALDECLTGLVKKALELSASIHMPRIGCGLAGGSWDKIQPIIENRLIAAGIDVYVYDWGGSKSDPVYVPVKME